MDFPPYKDGMYSVTAFHWLEAKDNVSETLGRHSDIQGTGEQGALCTSVCVYLVFSVFNSDYVLLCNKKQKHCFFFTTNVWDLNFRSILPLNNFKK